jgi:hypothetical protein
LKGFEMNYKYTDYDNFDELMDCDSQTANLLLKELDLDESDIGKEPWMDESINVYPNVEEYAVYELIDGWYQNHNLGGSFDGAPNPIEYIDLTDFGGDLITEGDASIVCLLQNGKVVTTSYGW